MSTNGLPSLLSRPAAVLPTAAAIGTTNDTVLGIALDTGIPARIPLTGAHVLVLSVGVGRTRDLLAADPSDIVIAAGDDTGATGASGASTPASDPTVLRDADAPRARLTLLDGATLGDSVPIVVGQPTTLTVSGRAIAEVTIEAITLTAGSLRSPGQYGSSVTLRWRDLHPATNAGPVLTTGDPSIPRRRWLAYLRTVRRG